MSCVCDRSQLKTGLSSGAHRGMHASGCGAGTMQEGSSGSGIVGADAASRGLPLSPHALSASGTSLPASLDDVAASPGHPVASLGDAMTSPGASFDPAGASPGASFDRAGASPDT